MSATTAPEIRLRTADDVPALVTLLAEQQAASSYPVRWPLPIPVEEFLIRPTELRAWVAVSGGDVVGHVAVASVDGPFAALFEAGTGTDRHDMVSVLFSGLASRGTGIGGRLLDTAVDWIRGRGRVPVLDVIAVHGAALAIYRRRGWVEVGAARMDWLEPGFPDAVLMALPPYPLGPVNRPSTSA